MAKQIIIILFSVQMLFGMDTHYERNCVTCHQAYKFDLRLLFFKYLLKYSSENEVKAALIYFLKSPDIHTSVMTNHYIKHYGLKKKSTLSDSQLKRAIDTYWEKYTVLGKIR